MPVMTRAPFEMAAAPEPLPPTVKPEEGSAATDQKPDDHDWLYEPPPTQPDPIFAEGGVTDYYYERLPEKPEPEPPPPPPERPVPPPIAEPAPTTTTEEYTIEEYNRRLAERKRKEEEWKRSLPARRAASAKREAEKQKLKDLRHAAGWTELIEKKERREAKAACASKGTTGRDVASSAIETVLNFAPGLGTLIDLGKASYHGIAAFGTYGKAHDEHVWEAEKSLFGTVPIAGDVAQVGEFGATAYDALPPSWKPKEPWRRGGRKPESCKAATANYKRAKEEYEAAQIALEEEKARRGL